MKFYQEITIVPNHEFATYIKISGKEFLNSYFVWSKLFTQLHLGLVSIQDEQQKSPIGISFPEYFMGAKLGVLGSKIRLFAKSESELARFDAAKWLARLSGYVHISGVREVPAKINGYAIYNRYQPKVNGDRLMRRHQKREEQWKSVVANPQSSAEEISKAQECLNKRSQRVNDYDIGDKSIKFPFIKLKSLSSDSEFCLWIRKTVADKENYEKFSTYGLSGVSTLPEF